MKYLNDKGLSHLISKIQTELKALREEISASQTEKDPDPSTWEGVQSIVRAGRAAEFFSVGDQFVCNHADFGEITWDIIGIDQDTPADTSLSHSLTLQTHDLLVPMTFDTADAVYYAADGLPAGNYWFRTTEGIDTEYGGGKAIAFTLTSPVPAGGVVTLEWTYATEANLATFYTYASRESTEEIESGCVSYASTGTELTPISDTISFRYGTNRWADSPIRKYLNSTAEKGAVWYPSSDFDRIPAWANNYAGFLKGLDTDLISVLGPVKVKEYDDNAGEMTETEDTVFLPSKGQVYAGPVPEDGDSQPYTYYVQNSSAGSACEDEDTGRVKQYEGEYNYWWLRSPEQDTRLLAYQVDDTGYVYSAPVSDEIYIAPVCCIV